jgi:hypothetical protein
MPSTPTTLPTLRAAASQDIVATTLTAYSVNNVKNTLLGMSSSLLTTESATTLWKTLPTNRFSISLRMLHSRLQNGYLAPSLLNTMSPASSPIANPSTKWHRQSTGATVVLGRSPRTIKEPMSRPLEDFEDLYYVLLSTVQGYHQTLSLRLQNGFSVPSDTLYAFGPTIFQFHDTLVQCWDALNEPGLIKTLDNAVRHARIKELHLDTVTKRSTGMLTPRDADELLSDLHGDENEVQGISFIGSWAPAMISAWLTEKYRTVLEAEKEEMKATEKMAMREGRQRVSRISGEPRMHRISGGAVMDEKEDAKKPSRSDVAIIRRRMEKQELKRKMDTEKREQAKKAKDNERLVGEFIVQANRVQEHGRYLRALAAVDLERNGEDMDVEDMEF